MILEKSFYHLLSSGVVGLLVWQLMRSTQLLSSVLPQNGSIHSMYWRQLAIPLLLSVWVHVLVFDIIEHGRLPKTMTGMNEILKVIGS